jgi:NADH dehydrogenase [ubiquinone] 1 alpha subcomplex assembly factor 7
MSHELEEIIKKRIRESGAISIAEYMQFALSHPEYGYYMQRDPLGADGDFTTAPEISQVFGETIGAWLAHSWKLLGKPAQIALVELGAGRGTLMADILRATKNVKNFHAAISVHLVEISPTLKQKQWKTLAGKHPSIEWHETIETLPPLPLFLVANEFFDAMPIRQFVGCKERMITLDTQENLCFTIGNDNITEICEPALAITSQICEHMKKYSGAAIIIDYGYVGGSAGDTLQAMKNHAYHPILQDVGDADLTAHLDFDSIAAIAKKAGLYVSETIPQGAFLMRLGAGERTTNLCAATNDIKQQKLLISGLKRLASPEQMGELFKVITISSA